MGLHWVLLLTSFVISSYASSATQPWLNPQLPKDLWPKQYMIIVKPFIYEMTYEGSSSIQLEVHNQTNFILVHSVGLNITETRLYTHNITRLSIVRTFAYEKNNYWVVETEKPLKVGDLFRLDIWFKGNLGILTGVINRGLVNVDNELHSPIVMTMLKPNYARQAFPNFDEPCFKSHFTVILHHWANYSVVSNMPEYNVTDMGGGWIKTRFNITPLISSFAVSFVYSQLVSRNITLADGKLHRVWVRPEKLDRLDYVFFVTSVIQCFFNRELGNITSLKKIDQFAMPFLVNRIGNAQWGLINQDEKRLIYNSTIVGDKYRQRYPALLATELAHNYFGDLITCRYWNHIWLDSALAHFYGLKATEVLEPIYLEEQALKEQALYADAFNHSHPLLVPRYNTTDDYVVNDHIIFFKGASVLKMAENFLGPQKFKLGIKRYIHEHLRKTTMTQDLFDALQSVADTWMNMTKIMAPWVNCMGFPLITIRRIPGNVVCVNQKRFLMDPLANLTYPPTIHGYKWFVPLNYRTKSGKMGRVWINQTTDAVFINLLNVNDNWIIFNYDKSGYYRVNYERPLWYNIIEQLKNDHTEFTDLERSQLLSDALNIAKAEQLGFDVALNLTMYASKERCLASWTPIYDALENIHRKLANGLHCLTYKRYVLNLTTDAMNELKVGDEGTSEQKLLRQKIMPLSCSACHKGCIENTTRLFKAWIQNEGLNVIPVNIRRIVYCHGIANTNESEWNTTFSRFLAKKQPTGDRESLITGLACTTNFRLIHRYTESFLSNNNDRQVWITDLQIALKKASADPIMSMRLWAWLKDRRAVIDERFFPGASASLAQDVTYNFDTETLRQDVRQFFVGMSSNKHVEDSKRLTEKRIRANIRWMKIQHPVVSSWLQENFPE